MKDFLQPYVGEFMAVLISGFGVWFFERRRKKVEVKSLEADHSKSIMDLYQEALDDLKKRYEERYLFLKTEYDLKFQNLNLQIDKLTRDQEMWKNKYTSLKKEFDAYKKSTSK